MKALIVVDIQNDFLPGGALAVSDGDAVIPIINEMMHQFPLVVATRDWHPANHQSFASQHPQNQIGDLIDLHGLDQILWPDHCIQGSHGAAFAEQIDSSRFQQIFQKGCSPEIDSYSGFFDNGQRQATGLSGYLKARGVAEIHVVGLALDYCVKFTALDGIEAGFATHLHPRASRGVELTPGDVAAAIAELKAAGVVVHE